MGQQEISRRDFVKTTAAGTATLLSASTSNVLGANEKVRVGFIGTGNRGQYNIKQFLLCPDAHIVAVCDVDRERMAQANELAGGEAEMFHDFRELLDRKDIDAVCITTPDHWHCLNFIYACEAKKDIYIDKPISVVITEGRAMVNAARKNNIVSQVGSEQHSTPHFLEAVDLIHRGVLGPISVVKCWNYGNTAPEGLGNPADCDPPETLDWDLWLGPAPKVPYNPNRCFYNYRWFWDYCGGQLTDWGAHHMDIILWALKEKAPRAVMCQGGIYALTDNRETPDTFECTWEIGEKTLVTYSYRNGNGFKHNGHSYGIEFYGTEGTMTLTRSGYEITPEKRRNAKTGEEELRCEAKESWGHDTQEVRQIQNFLDCVKSRDRCVCDIEWGHRFTSALQLGNVSYHAKQRVEWDAEKEQVTNLPEANKYLFKDYRHPWSYMEWLKS